MHVLYIDLPLLLFYIYLLPQVIVSLIIPLH